MLAGAMWLVVGTALAAFGARWTWLAVPDQAPWLTGLALAVGLCKSRCVLDGAALRIIDRIQSRGDGHCLGGFLSVRSWAFVLLMMVGGRLLRGTLSRAFIGPVYLAIGTALIVSSRLAWPSLRPSHRGSEASFSTSFPGAEKTTSDDQK